MDRTGRGGTGCLSRDHVEGGYPQWLGPCGATYARQRFGGPTDQPPGQRTYWRRGRREEGARAIAPQPRQHIRGCSVVAPKLVVGTMPVCGASPSASVGTRRWTATVVVTALHPNLCFNRVVCRRQSTDPVPTVAAVVLLGHCPHSAFDRLAHHPRPHLVRCTFFGGARPRLCASLGPLQSCRSGTTRSQT
jgi:hypothetical protein